MADSWKSSSSYTVLDERGRGRRVVYKIISPFVVLVIALVLAELALRVFPETLLGADLTARLFDRYNTSAHGMYFFEGQSEMNVMWPSFETRAYSHGYFWTHRTDPRGFRNPPNRQETEILLLGDSIIYGHGLEDHESVAGVLHDKFGHSVYNMSRQGDCLYTHYVMLRLHLEKFSPRVVLLFVFSNDLFDLVKARGIAQIDQAPELRSYDYEAIRRNIENSSTNKKTVPFYERLLLTRLAVIVQSTFDPAARGMNDEAQKHAELWRRSTKSRGIKEIDVALMNKILTNPNFERQVLGKLRELDSTQLTSVRRYYLRILRDLKDRAAKVRTRLVLVNLALLPKSVVRSKIGRHLDHFEDESGVRFTAEARKHVDTYVVRAREKTTAQVGRFVAAVAAETQMEYLDASKLFLDCDDCHLKRDGHLSATGHRRLAERIHEILLR